MFITNTTAITFDIAKEQELIELFMQSVDINEWTKSANGTTGGITFKRVQINRIWKEEEC